MSEFFNNNLGRIILTICVFILYPTLRHVINKILKNYSSHLFVSRTRTIIVKKTINFIIVLTAILILVTIWGVRPQNIFIALSSIFAVIGVALFAQWSILSNVTAGFILFFSLHLKIGDGIKILDKDFPVEAEVEDIRSFYIYLRGQNCERYVYPNNLLLQKGISILDSNNTNWKTCEEGSIL